MGRYRKILVAVDGSETSRNAFREACRMAREEGASLTAATAVPVFQEQYEVLSVDKATKALKDEGEKVLASINRIAGEEKMPVRLRMEEGNPFEAIRDLADGNGYDLVVMGRRGMKRLERALMGSVTARVIGHTAKDVLVAPRDTSIGWGRVLLPTEGSKCSEAAVSRAIDIAKSYGGQLTALSVVDVNEEFQTNAPEAVEKLVLQAKKVLDDVKKKAEAAGVNVETSLKEGEAFEAITGTAREKGASVIVMGSHGRTGLKRLLMGSVTEKVIGHAPCPVLVVSR